MSRLIAALPVLAPTLTGCAEPASPPAPSTVTASPSPAVTSPGDCASIEITITEGERPPAVCLAVGDTITFTSGPSALQPWAPVTSSDPSVLACVSDEHADGSVSGHCLARAAGTATVTTNTAAFSGDPAGPPQYGWHLDVTVVD